MPALNMYIQCEQDLVHMSLFFTQIYALGIVDLDQNQYDFVSDKMCKLCAG